LVPSALTWLSSVPSKGLALFVNDFPVYQTVKQSSGSFSRLCFHGFHVLFVNWVFCKYPEATFARDRPLYANCICLYSLQVFSCRDVFNSPDSIFNLKVAW